MIHSVHLSNFQKHRDLHVSFEPGLVTLRGANEAGKSTLLRGISYALFGTRTLPQSLEDTVTWGEPVASLKAEVVLSIDGVEYRVKRSKSGAEVNYDGGVVTGQTETVKFICSKLGVSADAANQLMVSNQSQIRGALEEGVAATTKLIESLAGFDRIDTLIELVQTRLPTGSTKAIEASLEIAQKQLESAQVRHATLADIEALSEECRTLAQQEQEGKGEHKQALQLAEQADDKLNILRRQREKFVDASGRVATAQARLKTARAKHDDLQSNPPDVPKGDIQKLLQQAYEGQARQQEVVRLREVYEHVLPLLGQTVPGDIAANNTQQEIEDEADELEGRRKSARDEVHKLEKKLVGLEKDLLDGTCSFCGQDFSEVPEVAKRNEKTQKAIEKAKQGVQDQKATIEQCGNELDELELLIDQIEKRRKALARFADYVVIDESNAALKAKWKGKVPPDMREIVDFGAHIYDLKRAEKALSDHDKAVAVAQANVQAEQGQLDAAQADLAELQPVDAVAVTDAQSAASEAQARAHDLSRRVQELSEQRRRADLRRTRAQVEQEEVTNMLASCKASVDRQQSLLKETQANNELLKALRLARPRVADKLWSLVLVAESRYFTQMRGKESRVTRDADGFKVNGHPVASLSGSTLDILGLAKRVALVRTFLPTAPFLVLDEPAAACDAERTQAMLGFLAATEFTQVLACSHDPISESVADSVITLSE